MSSNDPNQPGRRFDPQTGQPVDESQPSPPPQPTSQYGPPPGDYPAPPADPNAVEGYRVQPDPAPLAPTPVTPAAPYTSSAEVAVTKKRSNTPLIVGLVALLLLVGAGAGVAYFLNQTINRPALAAERALPANVLGYFSVDPVLNGSQKAAMDKMQEAFKSQPGFKEAWAKIAEQATELGGATGLPTPASTPQVGDFDALASYLGGNLTLAILPPSTDDLQKLKDASSSGDMEQVAGDVLGRNVVGLVDLDFNPLNKKGPIFDFKQKADAGKMEVAETYRDMEIRKYITGTNTLYFTLLQGSSTAAVGTKIEPVKIVIDQIKDNKGLKDDAAFKALSGQVPGERVASLYINLTEIYKQIGFVSPEAVQTVQNAQGAMLMTLSAHDDGMQIDIASQADFTNALAGTGSAVQVNPNAKPDASTVSDIPADPLGFLVGTDLQSVIKSALEAARKQGGDTADTVRSGEEQVKEITGKDLEADILPLLGGDYSLIVLPAPASSSDSVSAFIFQLKLKPGDHDKVLEVVDSTITQMSGGDVEKFEAVGGTFYDLAPGSDDSPVVGVTGDRLLMVVGSGSQSARSQLEPVTSGFGKGFGSTDAWRDRNGHLPPDSNIIGYLDITALRASLEKGMEPSRKADYERDAAPILRPFKYLLMGSATQAVREGNLSRNHTVIFLGIGK